MQFRYGCINYTFAGRIFFTPCSLCMHVVQALSCVKRAQNDNRSWSFTLTTVRKKSLTYFHISNKKGPFYLVIHWVSVVIVWENEFFALQDQGVAAKFDSRRLGATLSVAHRHQAVVVMLHQSQMGNSSNWCGAAVRKKLLPYYCTYYYY